MANITIDCNRLETIKIINNKEIQLEAIEVCKDSLMDQVNNIFTLKELLNGVEIEDILEAIGENKVIDYIEEEKPYLLN